MSVCAYSISKSVTKPDCRAAQLYLAYGKKHRQLRQWAIMCKPHLKTYLTVKLQRKHIFIDDIKEINFKMASAILDR